jgi:hypothetical protein
VSTPQIFLGWTVKINTKGENVKRTSSMIFALVLVLSLVLIMAGPMVTPVQAEPSGPKSGHIAENNVSIETESWSFLDNALEQDNEYATVLLQQSGNTSNYLKVTDFDFDIPGTAMIEGIEVEVDRHEDQTPLRVSDHSIRLVKDGTIDGDNRSEGATWPDSDDYESYGNSTDLWGLSWDPDAINDAGFGVAISAVLEGSSARIARVDHIRITVYYSVDEYYLTMVADPPQGGDAFDRTDDPPYVEDDEIEIEAEADTGYEFVEWTAVPTSGGTPTSDGFANANAEETIFTMPAYNVTVTASFSDEPHTQVPPTVTTVAASGITQSGATLNMDYTLEDWTSVELRFAYREHGTTSWSYTNEWLVRAQDGPWHKIIGELTADTEYDFQAQLRYDTTVINDAAILQFKTDKLESTICFVATAAYGTPTAEQIDVLREFRDSVLLESTAGSVFVSLYYQLSPPVADFIAGNELLRTLVREFLIDPIVRVVEATGDIWRN